MAGGWLMRGLVRAGLLLALCLPARAAIGAELPWFDGQRPAAAARQAVELLLDAPTHGLAAHDYAAQPLQQAVGRAAQGPPLDAAARERLAQGLTTAMRRYLADLHDGRVDPRQIHHDFNVSRRVRFDAAAQLQAALQRGDLHAAVRAAVPPLSQYAQLRDALARYRELAGHAAWREALPPLHPASPRTPGKLEPGQAYAGLRLLAERLIALGDLPTGTPLPPRYQGALVDGVRAFQRRHGLAADGVVGRATLAHLQVMPSARVRQIELALERLRWTPLLQGPRMVLINIPEFVLRAYEVRDGRIAVRVQMKVIVGKAFETDTPLFDEDMRSIEFSPYWNVPPSIARAETVPRLRRDPGFFDSQGLEFVAPDGQVLGTLTAQNLDAVIAGSLRIRQRPGPANALGDIKFVFPNRQSIYLHHTPATGLFARERRDLSHGCIRVEFPVALAGFVLQGMAGWDEARIREAMQAGRSTTLRLAEPLPVLIAYGTALVKDARVHFFDDIYGLDPVLDAALRQRPAWAWKLE
jgi:murein L,D-transpeptidase YcbB/YkuD